MSQSKADQIIEVVQKHCPGKTITMTTNIMEDLEISSLEIFAVISELEDALEIELTEREIQNITTIGDLVTVIEQME